MSTILQEPAIYFSPKFAKKLPRVTAPLSELKLILFYVDNVRSPLFQSRMHLYKLPASLIHRGKGSPKATFKRKNKENF